jgi:predicted nucleotidyltransferase
MFVPGMGTIKRHGAAPPNLGASLFGKGRRNVLAALFANPQREMYLRQIIAAVGTGAGQVQRELENLHGAGLVLRERRGKQVYYRPDPQAPIFEELKGIVLKTFGVADALREALSPHASKIDSAFIYGSVASQRDTAASDIDLLVVSDRVATSNLAVGLASVESRLKRRVSLVVYGRKEFRQRMRERHHFVTKVLERPKIMLIGDEHGLARLAGEKLHPKVPS